MENNILKEEIKKLKKDIVPRSEWITLSRDILLQKINPQEAHQPTRVGFGGYVEMFNQVFRQRLFEPAVIMLLVLGVFLGSSLTINAAFYSLPGESLYPVKIALEKTHAAMTTDDQKKVELKIEFAQKRIAELDKIISQSEVNSVAKKKKIEAAVQEFRNNVVAVSDQLNKIKDSDNNISSEDKEKTLRMAVAVSSKTEELAKSFDEKVGGLTEEEKSQVEEIIADVVTSAQNMNISAQALADRVEASDDTQDVEAGLVEGAELDEQEDEGIDEQVLEDEQVDPVEQKDDSTTEKAVE